MPPARCLGQKQDNPVSVTLQNPSSSLEQSLKDTIYKLFPAENVHYAGGAGGMESCWTLPSRPGLAVYFPPPAPIS